MPHNSSFIKTNEEIVFFVMLVNGSSLFFSISSLYGKCNLLLMDKLQGFRLLHVYSYNKTAF